MVFVPCILIPVYNHEHAIADVVDAISSHTDYPIILVDDGSSQNCHDVLESIESRFPHVSLLTLSQNMGKGGAVKAGLTHAQKMGFSHALQVDADGQHALGDIQQFFEQAMQNPEAMICGYPEYDESVPKVRYYSRYLTHVWVWINTLSFDIKDSMCGFRVYPLQRIDRVIQSAQIGNRMDFDTDIVVRWHWQGYDVVNLPTKVTYPLDGVSHFQGVKDNVLISWMHTRLFFGMVIRLPMILGRRIKRRLLGKAK